MSVSSPLKQPIRPLLGTSLLSGRGLTSLRELIRIVVDLRPLDASVVIRIHAPPFPGGPRFKKGQLYGDVDVPSVRAELHAMPDIFGERFMRSRGSESTKGKGENTKHVWTEQGGSQFPGGSGKEGRLSQRPARHRRQLGNRCSQLPSGRQKSEMRPTKHYL